MTPEKIDPHCRNNMVKRITEYQSTDRVVDSTTARAIIEEYFSDEEFYVHLRKVDVSLLLMDTIRDGGISN